MNTENKLGTYTTAENEVAEYLASTIRMVPHFPKQGIMYRDITTLLNNGGAFTTCLDDFITRYNSRDWQDKVDVVLGIESRGFIFGAPVAHWLTKPFVPARKPGKLPSKTICAEYDLEYGSTQMHLHEDAIKSGDRVLIFDDLIATGGTALCAAQLVEQLGGKVVEFAAVIDLPELGGSKKLLNAGYNVYVQTKFEGE